MSYLGQGLDYYRIQNGYVNLDVVRIGPGANPFFISSTLGPDASPSSPPPNRPDGTPDLPTVKTRAPRVIRSSRGINTPALESGNLSNLTLDITYKNKRESLVPRWVSNGTFFLTPRNKFGRVDYRLPSYVAGPVRDKRFSRADTPYKVRHGREGLRWYYSQPIEEPFNTRSFVHQSANSTAFSLSSTLASLIGGAGPLIINHIPFNQTDWIAEGFDSGQWYDAGPVIASNNQPEARRVHYLIMDRTRRRPHDNGWEKMVQYLSNRFISDLIAQGSVNDGAISNAVVFDAGGSKSLWVPGYVAPRGSRAVPHFLWLWGRP